MRTMCVLACVCAVAGASRLPAQDGVLQVDVQHRQLTIRGTVARQNVYEELKGVIEYVLCTPDGKMYEALFVCPVSPQALYDALVAIGLKAGSPASDDGRSYAAPTGDRLRIRVAWVRDGTPVDAHVGRFVIDTVTGQPLPVLDWVFTGSRTSRDPETGAMALQANVVGNLIALHHLDPTVLIQNPLAAARDDNRYKANSAELPPTGTEIALVFELPGAAGARPVTKEERLRGMHLLIRGRVQGVGFRAFTQRHARRLGVRGWVRNLPGGAVELVAEGSEPAVSELERLAGKGPRGARVDGVDVQGRYADERKIAGSSFDILATPER